MWQIINKECGKISHNDQKKNGKGKIKNPQEIAELFNFHFMEKQEKFEKNVTRNYSCKVLQHHLSIS